MSGPWVVHKFGGTSLANADRYREVAAILRAEEGSKKAVIVSAMHKVTDALIELVDLANAGRRLSRAGRRVSAPRSFTQARWLPR